jgi:NTP pyrophosphatase (non-canonical NTP hydrolase)
MNVDEHLMACLSEECVEVAKEVQKALRFGLDDRDPTLPGAPTQRARICEELNDLAAVADMLKSVGLIPEWFDLAAQARKKQKVGKFLNYAVERGTIKLADREAFTAGAAAGMAEIMAAKEQEVPRT